MPKRKLFITHAGELAHRLVCAIQRDGLVLQFLRAYAGKYSRPKLVADPFRILELQRTIGREACLLAAVELRRALPRALASAPGRALRPGEAAFAETFCREFLSSLERAMDWAPADVAAELASFRRDLELYGEWSLRPEARGRAVGAHESPFPDRCAILLDPAMMEQARRAASELETAISRTATRLLACLGGSRAEGSKANPSKRRARRRAREAARPTRIPQNGKATKSRRRPRRLGKTSKTGR